MDNDSAAASGPARPFGHPSRRAVLVAGAAGAGGVALAACSGSGPATSPLARTPTGTGSAASSPAAAGTVLARLEDIPVGASIAAELGGAPVLVCRPDASSAACFSAICTHMGCTVKPAGKQYRCPCHGSVYDARTGAVLHGPAPRSLARIPVRVADGQVVTGG